MRVGAEPIAFETYLQLCGPKDWTELINSVLVEKPMVQIEHELLEGWLYHLMGLTAAGEIDTMKGHQVSYTIPNVFNAYNPVGSPPPGTLIVQTITEPAGVDTTNNHRTITWNVVASGEVVFMGRFSLSR